MGELSRWEILLLLGAAFVAVTSLVKLMRQRRDLLVKQVEKQLHAERRRRKKLLQKQREQELEAQRRQAA